MSDTHGYHLDLEVPDGDILIHCGDAEGGNRWGRGHGRKGTGGRKSVPFPKFAKWLQRQPHRRKLFVEGNHEHYRFFGLLREHVLDGNLECLGLRIHGLPHSPSQLGYDAVPSGVDVLVSHVPPHGVLDEAALPQRDPTGPGKHIGSRRLRRRLAELGAEAPRLHLFGHVHEARGLKKSANGTISANVANANPGVAWCLHHGCMVFDVAVDGSKQVRVVKTSSEGLKRHPA